jgi:hypothetical protein
MPDMGLMGMAGAGGVATGLETLFNQRMEQAKLAQQASEFQQSQQQADALTRLKFQELAENTRLRMDAANQAEADRKDAQQTRERTQRENELNLIPPSQPISGTDVEPFTKTGISPARFAPVPITDAGLQPPDSIAADPTTQPQPVPGTIANSPAPNMVQFHRIATAPELQHQADQQQKLEEANAVNDLRRELADIKAGQQTTSGHYTLVPELGPDGNPTGKYRGFNTKLNQFEVPGGDAPAFTKPPVGASQFAHEKFTRQTGLAAVDRVDRDLKAADEAGLLGPSAGRYYEALQKLGSTGNNKLDYLIDRIDSDILLLGLHTDAGFGGARGASNAQLLERWKDKAATKNSLAMLQGYTGAIHDDMQAGLDLLPGGASNVPAAAPSDKASANRQKVLSAYDKEMQQHLPSMVNIPAAPVGTVRQAKEGWIQRGADGAWHVISGPDGKPPVVRYDQNGQVISGR